MLYQLIWEAFVILLVVGLAMFVFQIAIGVVFYGGLLFLGGWLWSLPEWYYNGLAIFPFGLALVAMANE